MKKSEAWLNTHSNMVLTSRVSNLPVMAKFGPNSGKGPSKPLPAENENGEQYMVVGKTPITGKEIIG